MSTVKMTRGKAKRVREDQQNGGGVPHVYTPQDIMKLDVAVSADGKTYVPARSLGWQGFCFLKRLKIAWRVFTGRYDALRWPIPPQGE
jgi:hypothetical protein